MGIQREIQDGWEFAVGLTGSDMAARMSEKYVGVIEETIKQLEDNINNQNYLNLGIGQLQGYMFEEWSAGTFNVDAVAANSTDRAILSHEKIKNSADIILKDSGKKYSAKSYLTPEKSVKAQASIDPNTGIENYAGQERMIPSDQLDGGKKVAKRLAFKNQNRPDVSKAYLETEKRLTDRISNDEGISSRPATRKDLETMAREGKKHEFKAGEHGLTAANAIKPEYLLKQALKAGYTAAAVTAVLQLAPEIFKTFDYLIKNGELDIKQMQNAGTKAISSGAEGFLRGSISASLLVKCETGAFGETFRKIDPTVLGTLVAFSIQTVKNSILVASGKMSSQEMGAAFADSVFISGGYLLGAHIGGAIGQALLFELPVAGYLLGSLLGTSFCVVYNIGKNKLISFCMDTGFTCFGLVDQNYELPEDIIKEMGIEIIPIPRTDIVTTDYKRTPISTTPINTTQFETIDIIVLRRGVIGVNKIGYIL